jgi:hypothetical protein
MFAAMHGFVTQEHVIPLVKYELEREKEFRVKNVPLFSGNRIA